jgi:hypothetical protein
MVNFSSTFCSISLNESTGAKGNVEVVQKALQSKKTQKNTIKFSFHVSMCILLFLAGSIGVCVAIFDQFNADQYLFLGALVSFCFSLIVILTYSTIPMLQGHPNPLIFSKRYMHTLFNLLLICRLT